MGCHGVSKPPVFFRPQGCHERRVWCFHRRGSGFLGEYRNSNLQKSSKLQLHPSPFPMATNHCGEFWHKSPGSSGPMVASTRPEPQRLRKKVSQVMLCHGITCPGHANIYPVILRILGFWTASHLWKSPSFLATQIASHMVDISSKSSTTTTPNTSLVGGFNPSGFFCCQTSWALGPRFVSSPCPGFAFSWGGHPQMKIKHITTTAGFYSLRNLPGSLWYHEIWTIVGAQPQPVGPLLVNWYREKFSSHQSNAHDGLHSPVKESCPEILKNTFRSSGADL